MKSECEIRFNNTNDTIHKNRIKKEINEMINNYDKTCVLCQIIKSRYIVLKLKLKFKVTMMFVLVVKLFSINYCLLL